MGYVVSALAGVRSAAPLFDDKQQDVMRREVCAHNMGISGTDIVEVCQ